MKKIKHWRGILIFIIFLIGRIVHGNSAEMAMEVNLELSDNEIILGQPLIMTMKLVNTGMSPIQLSASPTAYRIMISQDGKAYKQYLPTGEVIKMIGEESLLKSAETCIKYQIVLYTFFPVFPSEDEDLKHFVFPKPGKYFLKGEYGKFASTVVRLTVSNPEGEDAKAWAKLKKTDYPNLIHWPLDKIKETDLTIFREVLSLYPNAGYSKYLYSALMEYINSKDIVPETQILLNELKEWKEKHPEMSGIRYETMI